MGIVNVTPDSFSGDGVPDVAAATDARALPARRGRRPRRHRRGIDAPWARADRRGARSRAADPGRRGRARAGAGRDPLDRHLQGGRLSRGVRGRRRRAQLVWGLDDALADCGRGVRRAGRRHAQQTRRGLRTRRRRRGPRVPRRRGTNAPSAPASRRARDPRSRDRLRQDRRTQPRACSDRSTRIVGLGFPTLLGTSRKSTIGRLTGRAVDERAFGTAATVALADRGRHRRRAGARRRGDDRRRARRRRDRARLASRGLDGSVP